MIRSRVRGTVAGLATIVVFGTLLAGFGPSQQGKPDGDAPKKARPEGKPIPMPAHMTGLEIVLGLKDTKGTPWDGEIQVSEGKILEVEIARGNPKAAVDGTHFTVRSVQRMMMKQAVIDHPVLRVSLDAPPTATVNVKTKQGNFDFKLADVHSDSTKTYLEGQASAELQDPAVRLTGRETEDDYPALARSPDGSIWLAYIEYQPGKPIIMERVLAGNFEALQPTGHGDQVRLVRFDGKIWQPAIDVTAPGLSLWRPTVTVDTQGVVWVAWAQQVEDDWEIFYRRFTPADKESNKGQWSEPVRLTHTPGSDFNVVATTDSSGTVWLAWQGWRKDNFEILLAALADKHPYAEPRIISNSKANDWNPAITADSRGNVYVAWDTYDQGNYDVRLAVVGKDKESKVINVASSARFEARPSLTCDAQDRVWIAYEEGDEQWGKDYSNTTEFKKIGLARNPGYALYIDRTMQVKCLVDGKLMQPATDVHTAFVNKAKKNKSLPRLCVDTAGSLWLLFRQHPLPGGAGEVWNSYAVRYDGKKWSAPRRLSASANLLDNRPAVVPFGKGILTVYSGDKRIRTQLRDQNDLFATPLVAAGDSHPPELIADAAPPAAKLTVYHKDETGDVARMRDYRIDVGGKKLQLLRGEFHRHTEYSSHRDGDGTLEDAWRYGVDAAAMDWIGCGDHDNGFGHEYHWWQFQKMTDLYHNPPHFVGVYTYERSVVYPDGHRNVIMPKRGVRPLPRGNLKGTPEKGTPDTKLLYAYLKHFGGICASHTSATKMGTDWRDNNPEFEPIVEVYQGHRHNYEHLGAPRAPTKDTQIGGYEPAGFIWNALEKGYRFGFEASSDHISTHMSYSVVLAEETSRQGLIDAFRKRHCYGATDNILLDVRSGEHLQGDAFETKQRPTLEIKIHGTGPIAKLSIVRNNKYVYSSEPKEQVVKLTYTDMDAEAGATSYYYVRIEQADGNLAWASPMWITYKP